MRPGIAPDGNAYADYVVMTKKKNKQELAATPHPLLRLVSLGLLTYIFTLFSLELTLYDTLLAPLWFPTSIMMVAFFRHALRMWVPIALVCGAGTVLATLTLFPPGHLEPLYTVINIIEALVGATLLRKLLPWYNPLKNLNNWLRLALASAVLPPLVGGCLLAVISEHEVTLRVFLVWILSETIGALALVPLGLLFKARYLLRHRSPRLLAESLATLCITLLCSWLALHYLPWPFTFVIVLLMWSAIRLPRLEAFTVFLATVMMVSFVITSNPTLLDLPHEGIVVNAPWLPFLMILLPANVMTMVMYASREERKLITESETRFRNAMEYSAIGMALVSTEGSFLQVNKALCTFLGYTPEQLASMSFQQLTYPEDLHADMALVEKLLNGEMNNYSLEKRYYTRAGDVVWALLAVSIVRQRDGSPLYFIAQIEDITDLKRTEWVNKRLMERITLANEAGGIGIWEWELGTEVIAWDQRMFELYEVPPHTRPTYQLWKSRLLKEDVAQAEATIQEALRSRVPFKLEFRIQVKNGVRHIRALANRVLNKQGEVERLLGINMDMTEVKQLNEALFQEKERLHITLDSIGEAVICTDVAMNVTFMNPVAEKMSGWRQEEAIGQPVLAILRITFGDNGPLLEDIHSGDATHASTGIDQDVVLHCRSGGNYDIHYTITPLSTLEGENIGSVLVIHDVTESRKMLRQLSYSASHDALTHLANRVSFEAHLKRLLQSVSDTHQRHALVYIDLDRFKAVNDSAGHAAGDALLRELASLMLGMLRTTDVLARLGGDEFGLLLPDCSLENARTISERIVAAINEYPFVWESRLHRIGASAGITIIEAANNQAQEVMSQADIACYTSKNAGRGVVTVYEPHQQHNGRGTLTAHEQQRMITEHHQILMVRPVASPRVPETATFWLLSLRLWTSEGEMIEEHSFRAGLSDPELLQALDARLLADFFRDHAACVATKGVGVALTLSGATLLNAQRLDALLAQLAASPLPPRLLHFIVSSEVLTQDTATARRQLLRLREAGCRVVLSHVGRELEVFEHICAQCADYIMVASDLVMDAHASLMDEMLLTIVMGNARRIGLETIAGPADQQSLLETLASMGIDLVYGETVAQTQSLAARLATSYFSIH
ncbi:diguanylate cyclase [Cronobacter dublinensis]|uniref:diguanylate cyclase n=1 Tax=Cronobacter dublinensis TaxID=413497 RepID=UPI0024AED7D2|nr:diguanylate cyclase [Cronobacter dublinensis]EKM6457982.1 diguanylate cyclase [Cronobacter dublinensis]EKY3202290.1 diguanylate cyclase [Cronobacter dublinensis]ELQ6156738.1 diguanylate cyclase [Cronobacter dublinensis]ELY2818164.1 diguanylate cyclase [Cronobacter dublinensis]ELY4333888.1 diguanylate cyclase [Cronobacter dublinensis]